jgi:hypothetical protein
MRWSQWKPLEAASPLVGNDVQARSCSNLGPSGGSHPHSVGSSRTTSDEVSGTDSCSPEHGKIVKSWSRGQCQQLKQGVKKVGEVIDQLTMVAKCCKFNRRAMLASVRFFWWERSTVSDRPFHWKMGGVGTGGPYVWVGSFIPTRAKNNFATTR